MLLSTVDKFPALEDHKYEREKLFVKEAGQKNKKEESTAEVAAAGSGSAA